MSFRYLPHTGDLRAEVTAPDRAGLYQAAADLVRDVVVGASPVAERESRWLELEGGDEAERFFRFVRELVYWVDTDAFLPARVTLDGSAAVAGERFDPARHASERQLKAVTRHGFRLRRDGPWEAELVFDL